MHVLSGQHCWNGGSWYYHSRERSQWIAEWHALFLFQRPKIFLHCWFIPERGVNILIILFLAACHDLPGASAVWMFGKEARLDRRGDKDVRGEFKNNGASEPLGFQYFHFASITLHHRSSNRCIEPTRWGQAVGGVFNGLPNLARGKALTTTMNIADASSRLLSPLYSSVSRVLCLGAVTP